MPRLDLELGVLNGARNAEAGTEVGERAAPSLQPPDAGVAASPRTLRGRLFGRLADYARRYLTASVEHRLTLIQDQLHQQQALALGLERQNAVLRDLATRQASVLDRLEAALGRTGARIDDSIALTSAFGPRFDELEIQARPFVELDDHTFAKRLRDGYVLAPKSNAGFSLMLADATADGLEPGVRRVLAALALPGMTAVDVGANVGLLTLTLARGVGPAGKVLAFEPEEQPRRLLERMAALNGLAWIDVHGDAVGAKTETRDFNVSPVLGHSSLYPLPEEDGRGASVEVQVRPLDEVLAGQRLDVAKIDVEGAELDVLAGMSELISSNPDLAIVAEYGPSHLQRLGIDPQAWFAAFSEAGFAARHIDDRTGACYPVTPAQLAGVYSANIVFVKEGGSADSRLSR